MREIIKVEVTCLAVSVDDARNDVQGMCE